MSVPNNEIIELNKVKIVEIHQHRHEGEYDPAVQPPIPKTAPKSIQQSKPTNNLADAFDRVSDEKEEEESKRRQAIINEGKETDLPHRTVTSSTKGKGKKTGPEDAPMPKGANVSEGQVLVNKYIAIRNVNPVEAENIRSELTKDYNFSEEEINMMVNKSPQKIKGPEAKAVKFALNNPDGDATEI